MHRSSTEPIIVQQTLPDQKLEYEEKETNPGKDRKDYPAITPTLNSELVGDCLACRQVPTVYNPNVRKAQHPK